MVKVGLLATLRAKDGKEEELATFLAGALPLAEGEPATTAWFATKLDDSTFGVFDVFPDDAGRQAHLDGPIAAALMEKAGELLSEPPEIKSIEILAASFQRNVAHVSDFSRTPALSAATGEQVSD